MDSTEEANRPTIASIALPELADFGKRLLAEGFKVYVFRSRFDRGLWKLCLQDSDVIDMDHMIGPDWF